MVPLRLLDPPMLSVACMLPNGLPYQSFWILFATEFSENHSGKIYPVEKLHLCRTHMPFSCKTEFPKIIHQIWWNEDQEIPTKWKISIESCRKKNPEYEYKLWNMKDVEQLIREEYSWFESTFTGK